jgi:hypothetical protein
VCVLPLPSAHEAAGATGIRRSPRPLWAEDSSTARALRVARTNVCLMDKSTPHSQPSSPAKAGDPVFRGVGDGIEKLRRTGYSAGACHRALAEGETRWRSMTIFARSGLSRRSSTSDCVRRSSQSRRRKAEATKQSALSLLASRSGMKSRGALMEPLCALNSRDLELRQRASPLSHEPGGTKY